MPSSQAGPGPGAAVTRQFVCIRVRQALLSIPSTPTGHLYLIEGTLTDIRRYAGTTVDWVIKIAYLLCDPLGVGQVFTHNTGTPSDWYALDRTPSWRQVVQGDTLLPGVYEFQPATPIVLSKISTRTNHSLTTPGSESRSSTFRRHVALRDTACVVTRSPDSAIASYLIPKRIGSEGASAVVARFASVHAATGIHRYDARIGILLFSSLHELVNHYQLGFYHVMNDTYILHNFHPDRPDLSIVGATIPGLQMPPLHRHQVTLSVRGGRQPLPPRGVFEWHYLQCVINRFGTQQYKGLANINFFQYPFKTASDGSDEASSNDFDINPPYPSYHFDRYLEQQWESHWALERRKEVSEWASGVSSSKSWAKNT